MQIAGSKPACSQIRSRTSVAGCFPAWIATSTGSCRRGHQVRISIGFFAHTMSSAHGCLTERANMTQPLAFGTGLRGGCGWGPPRKSVSRSSRGLPSDLTAGTSRCSSNHTSVIGFPSSPSFDGSTMNCAHPLRYSARAVTVPTKPVTGSRTLSPRLIVIAHLLKNRTPSPTSPDLRLPQQGLECQIVYPLDQRP